MDIQDFSELLIEITGGQEPLMTLKEIAFIMDVDYQTAWGYRQGNSEPKWKAVCRLSHHMIKEHGYYKLAMQPMISVGGKSNGKVNDDLMLLFEAATDLNRAFPDDSTAFWNAYHRMQHQMEDLKSEGDKLK